MGIVQNGYIEPVDQEAYNNLNNLTQDQKHSLREQSKNDRNSSLYLHQAMHEPILPRVEYDYTYICHSPCNYIGIIMQY